MKAITCLRLIASVGTLIACLFSEFHWLWLSTAQENRKKKRTGLILVPEKKKALKPKKNTDNSDSKPAPILLPEVDANPFLRLVPGSVPLLVEAPAIRFEAEPAIPLPPAVTGVFTFATLTFRYDKRKLVTLSGKGSAKFYRENLGDDVWLELVEIPGGGFMMGAPPNEISSEGSERPQHKVTVPSFWIGKYEITQGQWRAVAKLPKVNLKLKPIPDLQLDPSFFKGDDNLPVEQVTWDEAVEFCARLAMKTGKPYRLPTEAEWEYAARAGTKTPFAFGETITPKIVNYNGNYPYTNRYPIGENREKTVPVGSLGVANAFGIFDMQGNVREWCLDRWHDNYKVGAPTDGSAWESGERDRVSRGGSWDGDADDSRSAARITYNYPYIRPKGQGFRIVAGRVF